jgi:hypothetical protein
MHYSPKSQLFRLVSKNVENNALVSSGPQITAKNTAMISMKVGIVGMHQALLRQVHFGLVWFTLRVILLKGLNKLFK